MLENNLVMLDLLDLVSDGFDICGLTVDDIF